jgi:hypothetical protein
VPQDDARACARKRWGWGRKALLCVVASALSLLVGEALLRIVDPFGISYHLAITRFLDLQTGVVQPAPPLPYRLRPGAEFDGPFAARINELGLRGPATTPDKPAETFRVLFLGDSVTFGLGVSDEACFVGRLRRRLAVLSAPRVEVLNGGCPGYNGVHEALFLRQYGLPLAPDLVVVLFIPDDPPRLYSEEEQQARALRQDDPLFRFFASPFLHDSYWKQLVKHCYWVQLQQQGQLEAVFNVGRSGIGEEARQAYCRVLDEMNRMCQEAGARFAVAAAGNPKFLEDYGRAQGWPFLRAADRSLEDTPDDLRLSAVDAHPNEKGHAVLADHLERALRAAQLIPGWTPVEAERETPKSP